MEQFDKEIGDVLTTDKDGNPVLVYIGYSQSLKVNYAWNAKTETINIVNTK